LNMNEDVWFGYHFHPEGVNFETVKNACLTAEKAGLDLFTVTDHFMNMANPRGRENHPLECWSLLAALAAVTRKIRLGPLVSCYAYRAPTLLGKIATTVDIISNGRLVMGLGACWHEAEFKGFLGRFPLPKERLQGFGDTLAIVHSMLENEYTTYKGKIFSVENTLNSPRPVQEHIPILAGAFGKTTVRIATRYADIIHGLYDPSPDQVAERKLVIKEGCEKTGRGPEEIRIGTHYSLWLNPTEEEINLRIAKLQLSAGTQAGNISKEQARQIVTNNPSTPDAHIEAIQELINNGVQVFTLVGPLPRLKVFAEKVVSKIK
jgi:alkanesulfonate monooxygenase SsuD/methylene tetrahydromethanopterin reductase-like flavin-dependent oxidoreductase (luciferase family)